jgi:hypothetical protein
MHLVIRVGGQAMDVLFPEDLKRPGVHAGAIDPAYTALSTGYRQALASGEATVQHEGVIAGRRVYWLRFVSSQSPPGGTEVAIDRHTYKPVVYRTGNVDYRVRTAETIDFRASDFKRVGTSFFDDFLTSSSGSSSPAGGNEHVALEAPWLTPGEQVAGLKLAAINNVEETTQGQTSKGIELVYGATRYG